MMKRLSRRGLSMPTIAVAIVMVVVVVFLVVGLGGGDTICQVVSISPQAALSGAPPDSEQWRSLAVQAYVPIGWRVKLTAKESGEEGKAVLQFSEGSEILVTTGSEIQIKAVTMAAKVLKSIEIRLSNGFGGFSIKPDPPKTVNVETNHAITSVLGTKFFINTDEKDTSVVVQEGKVKVVQKKGSGSCEVPAGSTWKTGTEAPKDLPAFFRKDDLWNMPPSELKKAIRQL